jgi:hypothetical protein
MRALEGVNGTATPNELHLAYPDRFNGRYLHRACARLFHKGKVTRRPGKRGSLFVRGSKWSYTIKRPQQSDDLRDHRRQRSPV